MKISNLLTVVFLLSLTSVLAQERTNLNLKDALVLLEKNNHEVALANTKAETKKYEWEQSKNHQYPDVKLSGQYMRLTDADVKLKFPSSSSGGSSSSPKVNQLMLGQANASLPLFSGGKIRNGIKASENLYKAEVANSLNSKEELAMKIIEYYAQLYKALKTVEFTQDNLKSAQERVKDFNNLEQNGIIARNDLLKAQLQLAKVQLSLDEANKNVNVVNFALVTLLDLPQDYKIGIDEHQFDGNTPLTPITSTEQAIQNRKDLEAVHYYQKANENSIKIARSGYYPSIALSAGYIALSLENVADVTNAMNFGGGISYNLSSLFKTTKEVKVAKSKAEELKQTEALLQEGIKIQTQQAFENFVLAQKQNKVYEQAIEQTKENYRIVKDKHTNGLATATELIDADVEQLNAQINFANSRANILLKYYEMLSVSGVLNSSFNLTK